MNRLHRLVVTAVTTASVVALLGAGSFAMENRAPDQDARGQRNECGCNQRKHKNFALLLKKKLNLTGKQAGEISDIMKEERANAKPLFEAVHKERKALRLLSLAEKTDEAQIKAQAARLADAESAVALHHAAVHKRIANVMTPEQAAKFAELSKKFAEREPGFWRNKGKKPRCNAEG